MAQGNTSNLIYLEPYTLDDLAPRLEAGWEEVAKLAETLCEKQGTGRSSFGLQGLDDDASFDARAQFGRDNKARAEKELGETLEFSSVRSEFHTQLMRRVIGREVDRLSLDGKFKFSNVVEAMTCRTSNPVDSLETRWGSELGYLQQLSEALASSADGYEALRKLAAPVDDKRLAIFLKTNPSIPKEKQKIFKLLGWACQSERNRREAFWRIALSVYLSPRVSQLRLIQWKLQQVRLCNTLSERVKKFRKRTKKIPSTEERSREIASFVEKLADAKADLPDRNECFLDTISLLGEFHAQLGRVDQSGSPHDFELEPVLDEFQERLNLIHSFNCLSDHELLVINEYLRYSRIQCTRIETSKRQYQPVTYCAVDVTELNYDPLFQLTERLRRNSDNQPLMAIAS